MAEHEPYGVKLQTVTVNIRLGASSDIQIRYLAGLFSIYQARYPRVVVLYSLCVTVEGS